MEQQEISDTQQNTDIATEAQEIPKVLRTPAHGCFEFYTGGWGTYIRSIEDPDANVILTKADLDTFTLKENINKIPADLWQRWVQLCFYFVEKVPSDVEVSVRILRSEADPTKYRILVPKQKVSAASVRIDSFDDAIDIETGEKLTSYPPAGWIPVGSSHSHNTMQAFFSSIDDKYELGDPGIHIVVGSINDKTRQYSIACSVVANGRRFKIDHKEILNCDPIENCLFHEDVTEYVDYTKPVFKPTVYSGNTNYQNAAWRNKNYYGTGTNKTGNYDYKSPFGFQDNLNEISDEDYAEFFGMDNYGTYETTETVKLYQVEDAIESFIKQHKDNPEELEELYSLLSVFIEEYHTSPV
jgi:hypothetical protein